MTGVRRTLFASRRRYVYGVHLSSGKAERPGGGGWVPARASAARKERLNRDRGGIDTLSMRNLAGELGVVPMALYKHVADKDELLDGMVDLVFAEIEFSSGSGWR